MHIGRIEVSELFKLLLILAVAGGAALTGFALVRLPLQMASAFVITMVGLVVVALALQRYGTRGVSSLALAAATITLGMTAIRVTNSVSLSDAFLVIAAVLLLPGLFGGDGWQRLEPIKWLAIGCLIIIAGAFFSSLLAPGITLSLNRLIRFSVPSLLFPILFALWKPSIEELRRIAWLWVSSVTISSLFAIRELGGIHVSRASGLTLHPNNLGITVALAIGPAITLTLLAKGFVRWIGLGACMVMGIGLMISGSRAGLIGALMSIIALLALSRRFSIAAGIGAAALIGIALISGGFIHLPAANAFSRLFDPGNPLVQQTVAGSDTGREVVLRAGLSQAASHPLTGIGFRGAVSSFNIYLQLWLGAGILGLIGFGVVIWSLLHVPFRTLFHKVKIADEESMMLLFGFSASYFGYLAAGPVINGLWERDLWFIPAFIAVLTPHAVRVLVSRKPHERRNERFTPIVPITPQPGEISTR